MSHALDERIREIARAPVLLVATDFDGTVAPIVSRPDQVDPNREAIVALRRLSETPDTHVAVISGRALADLSVRLPSIATARLVGSHGSEFEAGFVDSLTDSQRAKLQTVSDTLTVIAARFTGAFVERKPASVAFHYRAVDEARGTDVVAALANSGLGELALEVKRGKMVVEFGVMPLDKGVALEKIRQRLGATAVIYFGDDVTDEDAFATLRGPDVAVKVGDGESRASHRVADTEEVARVLARIAKLRSAWHCGTAEVPIDAHSLLSDQRTIALVAPNGRIPWLCLPRIDSPAIFAEILGGASAGFFEVRAADSRHSLHQNYVGDSMVLETHWPGFKVTDYLDAAAGMAFQRAGRSSLYRVIEGTGRVVVTFAPRFDFGRGDTRLQRIDGGIVIEGIVDPVVLHAPGVEFELFEEGHHQVARAELELGAEPVVLELRYGTANVAAPSIPERRRREQNVLFWQSWAAALRVPAAYAEPVRRSALVLKALTYGPTGAIAAAGTTSLPESLGGSRNWDYRFCWPRDAAVSAFALARIGATGIGQKLVDWLLAILEAAGHGAMLAPVYTVTGAHLPSEAELTHLHGYGGSRPVRSSNAAAQQIQLDVFGPICALIAELARQGCPLSGEHRRLVESIVAVIEQRWREPDHGIWEIRLPRRHHVHSKVMCWQAVDQAMEVSRYLGRVREDWRTLRDAIRAVVVEDGPAPGAAHFGTSFGSSEADAAALWVGLTGMLPPDDVRYRATIDAVERELTCPDGVYRYLFDDGLPGREGVFNVCTTWLVESLVATGRRADAEALFRRYLLRCGSTGTLSEEFDPIGRVALGNVPQAYSHAGLISAAVRLAGG